MPEISPLEEDGEPKLANEIIHYIINSHGATIVNKKYKKPKGILYNFYSNFNECLYDTERIEKSIKNPFKEKEKPVGQYNCM